MTRQTTTTTTSPRPSRARTTTDATVTGRLLGYARVSSKDQDPAPQVAALRAAGVSKVFTDKASGILRTRPGLDRLLAAALPGDTIAITRVDRLGRSLGDLVRLVDDLADCQLGIWVVQQGIDSRTDTGRLMLVLFGVLAESERAWMLDRTYDGLATARAAGRIGGRPVVMTDDKLAAARGLLAGGASAAAAAAAVGVGRSTLYRALAEQPPEEGVEGPSAEKTTLGRRWRCGARRNLQTPTGCMNPTLDTVSAAGIITGRISVAVPPVGEPVISIYNGVYSPVYDLQTAMGVTVMTSP